MTVGIKFLNNGLSTLLDNNRIVPQLVARFDLANEDQFDIETQQPGWFIRLFRWYIPEWLINRPYLIFFSVPDQGYEVYSDGFHVAYQAGQPYIAPILYVFALDYVTSSGARGLRMWRDNGGPLVYDSGNFHLNLRKTGLVSVDMEPGTKGLNYPGGGARSFSLGFSQNCAVNVPYTELFRQWGIRFGDYGQYRANAFCRLFNGQFQTKMFVTESEFHDGDDSSANYDHVYKGNGDSFRVMAIDRSMYD